jgi:hypothetical protein
VERGRLTVALRIEDERSIVFPETSVIIRDIERLLDLIAEHEARSRRQLRERPDSKRATRRWAEDA